MKKAFYYGVLVMMMFMVTNVSLRLVTTNNQISFDSHLAQIETMYQDEEKIDYIEKYNHIREEYNNQDIKAKISMPGLEIDNLLLQSSDNKYYLNHAEDGKYSTFGSIFIDYRTNIDTSKQINIYGHNSHVYDVPFSRLGNYLDKEFYENNKYIYIESENGLRTFVIYAVYGINDDDNDHMYVKFSSTKEYDNHFNKMKKKSVYSTGIEVNGDDTVLVLQTCFYNKNYGSYLIINAKEI